MNRTMPRSCPSLASWLPRFVRTTFTRASLAYKHLRACECSARCKERHVRHRPTTCSTRKNESLWRAMTSRRRVAYASPANAYFELIFCLEQECCSYEKRLDSVTRTSDTKPGDLFGRPAANALQ
jgi:hypothetical protein